MGNTSAQMSTPAPCKYGAQCNNKHACQYSHEDIPVCRYFQQGGCKYGEKCRYLHETSRQVATAAAAEEEEEEGEEEICGEGFFACPQDIIDATFAFLSFRELCSIRTVCHQFNDVILSEGMWAQMCYAQNMHGELREAKAGDPKEPHPFQLTGAPPEEDANSFVGWQMIGCLFGKDFTNVRSTDGCGQLTKARIDRFVSRFGAKLRETHHKLDTTCKKCKKDGPGKFFCIDCLCFYCGRDGGGCMAKHECPNREENQDCVTEGPIQAIGIRKDYENVYCYQHERTHSTTRRTDFATSLRSLQEANSRDTRFAFHHFGLYCRNQCPHVDELTIAKLQQEWQRHSKVHCNGKCLVKNKLDAEEPPPQMMRMRMGARPNHCGSMRVFFCLTCHKLFCGGSGHMLDHVRQTNHFVVVALRTLNIFCYSCDRYIGFGGSDADYKMGLTIRRIMRTPKELSQHNQFPDPEEDLLTGKKE